MTPTPGTWISTETSADAMAVRAAVFVAIMLVALIAAFAAREGMRAYTRQAGPAARQRIGRHPTGGAWACGVCRSVNPPGRATCSSCHTPRATAELVFEPVATAEDIVPASIAVPDGSRVTLEHNAGAHADGLNGHWRLRVNGVVVGTAARRDGALRLLRGIEGSDIVTFDPNGAGMAPYRVDALIAAFERPSLPLGAPCPEHQPGR